MATRPLTIRETAALLRRAGFRGARILIMTAIAIGESGLRPDAVGDVALQDSTWGPSVGLFQVRTLRNPGPGEHWRDRDKLMGDPLFQARAAYAISDRGRNFRPWTVFTSGAWRNHYADVRRELAGANLAGIPLPTARTAGVKVDPKELAKGVIPGPLDDWALDFFDDLKTGWVKDLLNGAKRVVLPLVLVAGGVVLVAGGVLKSGPGQTVVNTVIPGRSAAA